MGTSPCGTGIERLLNYAGRGEEGTGDDLPNVEGSEVQTVVELGGESMCLRPGAKLAKLLFDDSSWRVCLC